MRVDFEKVTEWMVMVCIAAILTVVVYTVVSTRNLPPCIKSHRSTVVTFMPVGKVLVPQFLPVTVCDLRAAK